MRLIINLNLKKEVQFKALCKFTYARYDGMMIPSNVWHFKVWKSDEFLNFIADLLAVLL